MRCPLCGFFLTDNKIDVCPECGGAFGRRARFFRVIAFMEDTLISVMLCSMILLVLVQIGLRNFYATGITGGAEMVRHLVLWVAFLGAGIAARNGKNIRIDIAQRIFPPGGRDFIEVVTSMFTTAVCALLVYASIQFVRADYSLGTTVAFFNMPVWIFEVIIPVGYCAVMLRYAATCRLSLSRLVRGR
jgi:TRAP-type C4-dicarboxylate transport system permease small subunit